MREWTKTWATCVVYERSLRLTHSKNSIYLWRYIVRRRRNRQWHCEIQCMQNEYIVWNEQHTSTQYRSKKKLLNKYKLCTLTTPNPLVRFIWMGFSGGPNETSNHRERNAFWNWFLIKYIYIDPDSFSSFFLLSLTLNSSSSCFHFE